ncbi:MAG: hypothetical protein ABJI22_08410 [Maribacter sp.]
MKFRIHLVLSILFLLVLGCGNGKTKIVDYYYIYDYVDFDNHRNPIDGKNVLMCNPAFKDDPFIMNLEVVEWNDSVIIITKADGHYTIEANSNGLCCGCGNEINGPFTSNELYNFKSRKNFKIFKKIEINH